MTWLPHDNRSVKGIKRPTYPPNPYCPVPDCGQAAPERHHIWRRSFLAGPYDWVELWDGTVVGNVVNLCNKHHSDVTVNAAGIEYEGGLFYWNDLMEVKLPLRYQPPIVVDGVPGELDPPELVHEGLVVPELGDAYDVLNDQIMPGLVEHVWASDEEKRAAPLDDLHLNAKAEAFEVVTEETLDHKCPTCKRRMPKPKIETEMEEKKPRKTWSVMVPKDKLEDGAEALDTLIEEAREELAKHGLSYGDGNAVKYYPLTMALALFVTHADSILGDL